MRGRKSRVILSGQFAFCQNKYLRILQDWDFTDLPITFCGNIVAFISSNEIWLKIYGIMVYVTIIFSHEIPFFSDMFSETYFMGMFYRIH